MISTFICRHCGRRCRCNPRIKNQKYCSNEECQKARKRTWKKGQYKKNKSYKEKSQTAQKVWRKNYPADQYQSEYRTAHPEYVKRNRELQGERNKNRQREQASMIVKTDALLLQPREDGAYMLSKVKKSMIVNRNALSLQPSVDGVYALFKVKYQKIVNRNALMAGSQ